MIAYEVEVTVRNATPPRNVSTPFKITFVIKTDSEINAITEALNNARRRQSEKPRVFKNAIFVCERPCIREAFTKDVLH